MKVARKIFFYLSLALVVVLLVFGGSVILFKDKIIQQFIREANKNLSTPIQIGKIDISAWADFPNLAISFTDVYVEDSHSGIYPLLTAKTASFSLNALEVWQGKYSVRGLKISECEVHLKINSRGENNFSILKKTDSAHNIGFDLHKINLINLKLTYHDLQLQQRHEFESKKLITSVSNFDHLYKIETEGDVTIGQIGIKKLLLLEKKKFDISGSVSYDEQKKKIVIEKTGLHLGKSAFEVEGSFEFKTNDFIHLKASGKNTDIQTVLSLFPESTVHKLKVYESKGDIYFSVSVNGELKKPLVSAKFGCQNASFFHPQYKSKIEEANLRGSFASVSFTDFSSAELFIKDFSGKINGKPFEAEFSAQDFDDPYISLKYKGELDASSIQNLYPIENIKDFTGAINADISLDGKISLLKKKATAQQVQTSGKIDLREIAFTLVKPTVHFEKISGSLNFNKNDIAMSNLSGKLDRNDFLLNGFLKNVITFLLFENQPIGIETDLKSEFLDLDQLVALGLGETGSKDFGFSISPQLHLNFNCDVQRMKYKRFAPRKIKGNLLVKNQVAVSRNLSLQAMGGSLEVNGIVDAKNTKVIDVSSSFKLKDIYIDSVFYVFENFYQDFIEAKHLKGKANADVSLEMALNEKLKLFPETLTANISALIKNGELNNFEPLQKLNRYLDDQALNQLRFADLKNDIHIENKTIYIPQMEVHSNATNISLSGKHSFDQQIDYRIVAPLRNKKKIDPDEAFGAIEDTGGQSKIFLKIIGTTANYEVKVDKEATKKKIVSDLKKEAKELKDAFQNREIKKKKEVELQKDDYFDWDN